MKINYLEGAMIPYFGDGTGLETGMLGKLLLGGGLMLESVKKQKCMFMKDRH